MERGDKLLVIFEFIDDILERNDGLLPTGWETSEAHGWSYLCLALTKANQSHLNDVFACFEELSAEGIFARHAKSVFFGQQNMSGEACVFSAYSQHASIVMVEPTEDLASAVIFGTNVSAITTIGNIPAKALSDAVNAVNWVAIALDPSEYDRRFDHQSQRDKCFILNCRHMSPNTASFVRQLDLTSRFFEQAMSDSPDFEVLYQDLRLRRDLKTYLRHLLRKTRSNERTRLEKLLCQNVVSRMHAPFFESCLKRL